MFEPKFHYPTGLSLILCLTITLLLSSCTNPTSSTAQNTSSNSTTDIVSSNPDTSSVEEESSLDSPSEKASSIESSSVDSSISHNPYEEDALQLIQYVEETHPAFLLEKDLTAYTKAKEEYLDSLKIQSSLEDFRLNTKKYLCSLKDAHTNIGLQMYDYINLNCVENEQGQIVLWDATNQMPSTKVITSIGGKSISNILSEIDTYWVSENASAKAYNHTHRFYKDFLQHIGCEITDDQIQVTYELDGNSTQNSYSFVEDESPSEEQPDISSKWLDDIYYIDLNTCFPKDEDFRQEILLLKKALQDQTLHKVIVDVRGNGGGNADYCRELIKALNMNPPELGAFFRYSPLTVKTRNTVKNTGSDFFESNLIVALPNKNIDLVVLTDEMTFSAATIFASLVQDGKLGTLIGRPSQNSPSFYADVVPFELSNSHIMGQISSSRCYRADTNADQITLQPDILTNLGEDSLERAISYLNEQ